MKSLVQRVKQFALPIVAAGSLVGCATQDYVHYPNPNLTPQQQEEENARARQQFFGGFLLKATGVPVLNMAGNELLNQNKAETEAKQYNQQQNYHQPINQTDGRARVLSLLNTGVDIVTANRWEDNGNTRPEYGEFSGQSDFFTTNDKIYILMINRANFSSEGWRYQTRNIDTGEKIEEGDSKGMRTTGISAIYAPGELKPGRYQCNFYLGPAKEINRFRTIPFTVKATPEASSPSEK